jgi:hypothetical protein
MTEIDVVFRRKSTFEDEFLSLFSEFQGQNRMLAEFINNNMNA